MSVPGSEARTHPLFDDDELDILACVLESALDTGWFDDDENNPWRDKAGALADKLEKHGFVRKALL